MKYNLLYLRYKKYFFFIGLHFLHLLHRLDLINEKLCDTIQNKDLVKYLP